MKNQEASSVLPRKTDCLDTKNGVPARGVRVVQCRLVDPAIRLLDHVFGMIDGELRAKIIELVEPVMVARIGFWKSFPNRQIRLRPRWKRPG